jgi:hypothetical protein
MTGGPLVLRRDLEKLVLISCTIDPGYDNNRFLGIEIERYEKAMNENNNNNYSPTANVNDNAYDSQDANTSLKEIILVKSISGAIKVDNSVSLIRVEDSIVDNLGGSAISLKENNGREKNPILKLEVMRSNILSRYQDPYILDLRAILCINSILTNKVNVKRNEKQDQNNNNHNNNKIIKYCKD